MISNNTTLSKHYNFPVETFYFIFTDITCNKNYKIFLFLITLSFDLISHGKVMPDFF